MSIATLAYSTSSRAARVSDRMARVAAAGRVADERRRAEARAEAEHTGNVVRAARITAELISEHGETETYGMKVCADDAKWRAVDVTPEFLGWILATEADVEYWLMSER